MEILVVIGILAILLTVGIPFGANLFITDQHTESIGIVSDAFALARQNALASQDDASWTLRLSGQSVAVSSGTTFNEGTATTWTLPAKSSLSVSGNQDITFDKHTGETQNTSFTLTTQSQTTSFSLYASGALSTQ